MIKRKISRWRNYPGPSEWTVNVVAGVLTRRRPRAVGRQNRSSARAEAMLLALKTEEAGVEGSSGSRKRQRKGLFLGHPGGSVG